MRETTKQFEILKSDRGYTITSVLVVSGLATIVFIMAAQIISNSVQHLNRMKTLTAVSNIRSNLVGVMQNESAWFLTITDVDNSANASGFIECLQENPNSLDCNNKGGPLRIIGAGGTPYLDPVNSATAGFTLDGQPCDQFDPNNGNNACPIRVEIDWQTVCDPLSVCTSPGIAVNVVFQIRKEDGSRVVAFNAENYNFTVYR